MSVKEARFWRDGSSGTVRCELCPNYCVIKDGAAGRCRVRRNRDGALFADGYGVLSSSHVDPIEKKPLYHFYPGTEIFSIGGWGCNFSCGFCQNWSISQDFTEREQYTPKQVVDAAARSGAPAIAYTYNEPLIGIEWVLNCAALARARGLKNVAVTNGYICAEPGREVIGAMDAFNVDIKSIDEEFYKKHCGGHVKPVLDFCAAVKEGERHLEITNLVIPGENDSEDAIERLTRWVAQNLGKETPLHFSAYHPQYKMEIPATGAGILHHVYEQACKYLYYVYLGNIPTSQGQNSRCPHCDACLVERSVYKATIVGVRGNQCSSCGMDLAGFTLN